MDLAGRRDHTDIAGTGDIDIQVRHARIDLDVTRTGNGQLGILKFSTINAHITRTADRDIQITTAAARANVTRTANEILGYELLGLTFLFPSGKCN